MCLARRPRAFALLTVLVASVSVAAVAAEGPAWRDKALPVEARVKDLLARMTLEEKVAQLGGVWQKKAALQDDKGLFDPGKAKAVLGNGIGQVSRPSEITMPGGPGRGPREAVAYVNAVQKFLVEGTRLGIPAMFHEEAVHGFVAPGATNFPVPIGLACTWDVDLLERVMTVAAREARARGIQEVLAPVLDLARDPRWGRTEETYGEDPYLTTRLGVAAIRGYQGKGLPLGPGRVFATAKHFAGHGPHEGGINTAPVFFGERVLREQYLRPFEAAIREAGAYTVMPSYNEIDGVPSHKSRFLIEKVLRGEWAFSGLVVSDYFGISQLQDRHAVARDAADAARQALLAGVDVELPDAPTFSTLAQQVKDKQLDEAVVDRAAARVLAAKFLSGVMDSPYADAEEAVRVTNTTEHRALALEAARKAIVLLQNDGGALPLDRTKLKSLAVIGPNAKGVHLGGYSVDPGRGVDVLTGIQEKLGASVRVVHAEGTRITEQPASFATWYKDDVVAGDPAKNRERIAEAARVAATADVVVLVLGGNESTSREAWADNHLGDADTLDLPGQQDELIEAVAKAGKPMVAVLLNGRPHSIVKLAATVPAILEGFYLGQEGGTAVADVLFGDVNPSGKLPISIPRGVGQLPVYHGRKPTSYRPYLFATRDSLFTFGHGLSYSTFAMGELKVEPATIAPTGRAQVSARVTNKSQRAGETVVQLYIRDRVSSVTRPLEELAGFTRVSLAPGEAKTVRFELGPEALSLLDEDLRRVVEPGTFDVMVGTSLSESVKATLEVAAR